MKNNYAFIDGENLYQGVRKDIINRKTGKVIFRGWKLDYRKFRQYLKNKFEIDKAYLFIGYLKKNKTLYNKLRKDGFVIIFKEVSETTNKSGKLVFKGNVDAELVLQVMIEFNNYNKAVIVSNDGDFYCLVRYLLNKGKLLKLISPNGYYSKLYRKHLDNIFILSDLRSHLEIKNAEISVRTNP